MSSQHVNLTIASPGDTNLHFVGNGKGSFTSVVATLAALAITASTGTSLSTATGTYGPVGTVYYVFTSDGYFSTCVVTVSLGGGLGGTVECLRQWCHADRTKTGKAPSTASTVTMHTQSAWGDSRSCVLEGFTLRGNLVAATILTITDSIGTTLRTYTFPFAAATIPTPDEITIPGDGIEIFGPFGFSVNVGNQLALDIHYRAGLRVERPAFTQSL